MNDSMPRTGARTPRLLEKRSLGLLACAALWGLVGCSGAEDSGGGGHPSDSHGRPVDTDDIDTIPSKGVVPNLDSAILNIDDPVQGAKDYRAFAVREGVKLVVDSQGREHVSGATIFCAGLRQRAAPALAEPEVVRQIEVTDLKEPTEFVVEAIDTLCPFPGALGRSDMTIDVVSPDAIQFHPELVVPFPIVSEATIRERYGSLIVNGQGPAAQPGQPAEPVDPKVLKQWKVNVAPLDEASAAKRRTSTFFADFSENDPFEPVPPGDEDFHNGDGTWHQAENFGYNFGVHQNSQFSAYTTNTELANDNHFFLDRGQLHTVLPDGGQDVMGTTVTLPRKLAHFSEEGYLRVTFEGSTNSTARRYWWLSLCGADEAGKTKAIIEPVANQGLMNSILSLGSGFWNADGSNPSVAGWNCLLVFPHDGIGTPVPVTSTTTENPQSSIIVVVHESNRPRQETAVNVSPQQLNDGYPPAWYRQMKAGVVTETGLLDDLLQNAPRVHFDLFVSRNRLVMYVNGQQRLCNDFGPVKLTMAEAAIGFNDALYHSSAEHTELTLDFADRSGQLHYLQNTLFLEPHTWDNVGFDENVGLPESFDEADCYTYAP